ncbi:MAG: hypothetical protein HOY78_02400 [Saccharothrix sp.]|nr:hypothetical protein [Saccharothrix sp.]
MNPHPTPPRPDRPTGPVDHGCLSSLLVVVPDHASTVWCVDCLRGWSLGPGGWSEVTPWRS